MLDRRLPIARIGFKTTLDRSDVNDQSGNKKRRWSEDGTEDLSTEDKSGAGSPCTSNLSLNTWTILYRSLVDGPRSWFSRSVSNGESISNRTKSRNESMNTYELWKYEECGEHDSQTEKYDSSLVEHSWQFSRYSFADWYHSI